MSYRVRTDTYTKVHKELRLKRGSAKDHTCPCGKPAVDWAYQFTGVELRDANGGSPHSVDINDYEALCRKCHDEFDREHDPAMVEKKEAGRAEGWKKAGQDAGNRLARLRKLDPELDERLRDTSSQTAKSTNAVRVECRTCGMVTTRGAMGMHLYATGHEKGKIVI